MKVMPGQGYTGSKIKLNESGRKNMELDDFKKKKEQTTVKPTTEDKEFEERMNLLICLFESDQKRQRRISIFWAAILLMLSFSYLSLKRLHAGLSDAGVLITITGFILGAAYVYFRYKPLDPLSYSLPVPEFLSKAKNKLAFLNLTDWFIIITLLMILGTGGGFILIESLLKYTDNLTLLIIIWIIFFISLCIFGFWAGKRNWKKNYGDLLEKIAEMKNSYSGNHDTIE